MNHQNDQHVIDQTLAGEVQAFATLVDRYQHMVYTLAVRMLKDEQDAQEVAQDAFVKAFQKLDTFAGKSKFSTWLYRITYNKCLDTLSRKRRQPHTEDTSILADTSAQGSTSAALETAELKEQIAHCIGKLNESDAVIITLFYLDEQSLDEIAVVLSMASNTVKVKLHRARKKLYEIMATQLPQALREDYERTR